MGLTTWAYPGQVRDYSVERDWSEDAFANDVAMLLGNGDAAPLRIAASDAGSVGAIGRWDWRDANPISDRAIAPAGVLATKLFGVQLLRFTVANDEINYGVDFVLGDPMVLNIEPGVSPGHPYGHEFQARLIGLQFSEASNADGPGTIEFTTVWTS